MSLFSLGGKHSHLFHGSASWIFVLVASPAGLTLGHYMRWVDSFAKQRGQSHPLLS
jgi:hypothetical protein